MKRISAWALAIVLIYPQIPLRAMETTLPETVSVNFQNTDLDIVLNFFSQVTGKTFIKSDGVRGFVSVAAPGQIPISEALQILQAVLELRGFTMVPGAGKIVKVISQAEAVQSNIEVKFSTELLDDGSDRMLTQVVPLSFVPAQDIKNEIGPLLSKSGSIIANERTNTLVITDMASNIRRLQKIIRSLDIKTPQVLIEALIMEISLTQETKLGLEWSFSDTFNASGRGFSESVGQTFSLSSFITEGLKYSVLRSDEKVKGLLQALAADKNVNILSTPHIMTVNNQPATIRVGEEVPVLTQTRNIQGGETIRSFDYKSVAIELEVTPRINPEREVLLKVHPLVKKILGFNAELNAPILATREAQTSVLVGDNQTVVIGGLMKDDRSLNESKIPILGDIPLLGMLFRKRGSTKEKTELLVFITPRVIQSTQEAEAVTIQKEAESKSPQTPHRLKAKMQYQLGKALAKEKKFAEAISAWELAIALSPDEKLKKAARKRIAEAGRHRY